jgi:hypothetical protein
MFSFFVYCAYIGGLESSSKKPVNVAFRTQNTIQNVSNSYLQTDTYKKEWNIPNEMPRLHAEMHRTDTVEHIHAARSSN